MNKHLLLAKSLLTRTIIYGALFASFLTFSPAHSPAQSLSLEEDSSRAISLAPDHSGENFSSLFTLALEHVGDFTLSGISSLKNVLGIVIEENEIDPLSTLFSSNPPELRTNSHLKRNLLSHHVSITTRISKSGNKSELRNHRLGVRQDAFERF